MGETWVLKEMLNKVGLEEVTINFTVANIPYKSLEYDSTNDELKYHGELIGEYIVYSNGWGQASNRTIVFDTPPAGTLLAWLQANGVKEGDAAQLSVDITTLPKYSSIPLGTHKLTIVASAPGYLDSDPSQEATFINGYPITFNVTNCTYSPSAEMVAVFEPTTFIFTKSTGYSLPSSISITGVTSDKYTWAVASDGLTATLVIAEPTGAVTVNVAGVAEVYSITVSAPHTTHTGATTITYGQTATLVFTFNKGYEAPDTVTVTGASGIWTKSTGTLVLLGAEGNVSVSLTAVAKTYAIKVTGVHASATDGSPTTIKYGGTATLSFDYDKGYFAPASATVNNATGNWNQGTNELVITNPDDTGDVIVIIEAIEKTYDIKYALTNLAAASSNPTTITSAATGVELTISGTTYYALPTSITVSGVASGDWSYDQSVGKVTLSYPTGTVTITAVGVEITETLDGIWSWKTTIPDGAWTEQTVNFTSNGMTFAGMRWNGYNLYYVDSRGENETKVYSLNEDTQVGTWEDGGERSYWRIVDFGTTEEIVSQIFADYVNTNAVLSGKLATPTGVQVADGTVVSWDAVENATEYEVVVDNVSWGVCEPTVYEYTQDGDTVTIQSAPYTQQDDTVTIE